MTDYPRASGTPVAPLMRDTLTLYNRHGDGWKRTLMRFVLCRDKSGDEGNSRSPAGELVVYIFDRAMRCGKRYMPKPIWNASVGVDDYFTLAAGDIIVRGECGDAQPPADGCRRITRVLRYPGCSAMRHFRLTAE